MRYFVFYKSNLFTYKHVRSSFTNQFLNLRKLDEYGVYIHLH